MPSANEAATKRADRLRAGMNKCDARSRCRTDRSDQQAGQLRSWPVRMSGHIKNPATGPARPGISSKACIRIAVMALNMIRADDNCQRARPGHGSRRVGDRIVSSCIEFPSFGRLPAFPKRRDFSAQRTYFLELLGDIAHDRRNSGHRAVIIEERHDGESNRDALAVLSEWRGPTKSGHRRSGFGPSASLHDSRSNAAHEALRG